MSFLFKNRDDLEKLEELASFIEQVKAVRLQENLGKDYVHVDMKKVFEPMTDIVKVVSSSKTKTITETSIENNQTIEKLNEKVLELMIDKGMLAPYLSSFLVNLFKPEIKSQFRLMKDLNSAKMNENFINTSVPLTPFSNLLIFRDSNESFRLDGDLLKTITNYKFNVDHSNPQDRKLIYEFGKEMEFENKPTGRPSNRDKSMIILFNSPATMASGISNTMFCHVILRNYVID